MFGLPHSEVPQEFGRANADLIPEQMGEVGDGQPNGARKIRHVRGLVAITADQIDSGLDSDIRLFAASWLGGHTTGEFTVNRVNLQDISMALATSSRYSTASSPQFVTNRSEEHTSELQSPCNLVCRLLLEKKNTITHTRHYLYRQTYTLTGCCLGRRR